VARAKAEPGKLNYGSFGIGNLTHLMGVLMSTTAGIEMTHVPYKGQTPEMTDLIAGQIPVGFTTLAGASGFVEAKQLDLLATFGAKRDAQFPNTPTVAESGYPGVVIVGWSGILAPSQVPKSIIDKLHAALIKVLAMPDVRDAITKQGSNPVTSASPDAFGKFIRSEMDKFRPVVQAAGLEGSQ
jgi:tripartite-type tricarboxylate transporter receptor subunit TctC